MKATIKMYIDGWDWLEKEIDLPDAEPIGNGKVSKAQRWVLLEKRHDKREKVIMDEVQDLMTEYPSKIAYCECQFMVTIGSLVNQVDLTEEDIHDFEKQFRLTHKKIDDGQ